MTSELYAVRSDDSIMFDVILIYYMVILIAYLPDSNDLTRRFCFCYLSLVSLDGLKLEPMSLNLINKSVVLDVT